MEDRMIRLWMRESPIAMYMCDNEGFITDFNEAAAELWGRTPLIGIDKWWGAHRSYHPDGSVMKPDQTPLAQMIQHDAVPGHYEIIVERPDGSRRKLCVTPKARVEGGPRLGAWAYFVDTTSSEEVETKQALLSAIVESSDDAIITKNLNGLITSWNKGAESIFGYTEREALGKPISILIPEERIAEETYCNRTG